MKTTHLLSVLALAATVVSAQANTIFTDDFEGNTNVNLATQTFSSAATTNFSFWEIGTPNNMDAGFFSVVNKASDVHTLFTSKLDADGNNDGHYSVYNGYSNQDGLAYRKTANVNIGDTVTVSAYFLTLAANPPFDQNSWIEFRAGGAAIGSVIQLLPVPLGTEVWTQYSQSFVATSTSVDIDIVNLGGLSNAGNDFGIDNVKIESVPEPATLTLLACAAAAFAKRRRK
ncbi:MAG: PEP-CTERM sorting domain-containing protein [Fimbriimonadaceae bacterium]